MNNFVKEPKNIIMNLGIQEKTAIICASSKGLGKACAQMLSQEGVNVVICSRNYENALQTAQEIQKETNNPTLAVACDLNDAASREELVKKTLERFSTIDILVTNVGHPSHGGLQALNQNDWDLGYQNILYPSVHLCQMVIPHMQKSKWGRIVNISSYVVKMPNPKYLISTVFRTSLLALSQSLSQEFGPDGILVNTVCPSLFRTPLGERLIKKWAEQANKTVEQIEAEKADITQLKRIGEPDDLASLVTFLCSQKANYITGQSILLDGGQSKSLL